MKILYIGSGFVGACSAAVSANSGHETLAYDINEDRIKKLGSKDRDLIESCLYEDGLADLLVRNSEFITFTSSYDDVEKFLDNCDAVFMVLPTPEIGETGESNLAYYFDAAEGLAASLVKRNGKTQSKYIVIVNKSTVPINMMERTEEIMNKHGVKNYGVVSNPEFLVEGKAVQGSIAPDRVVVGAKTERDFAVMRSLYQRFFDSTAVKYIEVSPREAEAGKLLANFYLFNRLAVCFDIIGRVCETFEGVNYEAVRDVLISDKRIGTWGFYDSLYAGGSCFIKDARSLSHQLQTAGRDASLVNETYLANKRQLENFIGRAEKEINFDWTGKRVAILGLAFKQDTNDVRNSPSINILNYIQEKQVAEVRLFDPRAAAEFKKLFPASDRVLYVSDEEAAIQGADVVIIATDWPQFRGVAELLLSGSTRPLIMDGRRMLHHRYSELQAKGFTIIAVGSPVIG